MLYGLNLLVDSVSESLDRVLQTVLRSDVRIADLGDVSRHVDNCPELSVIPGSELSNHVAVKLRGEKPVHGTADHARLPNSNPMCPGQAFVIECFSEGMTPWKSPPPV